MAALSLMTLEVSHLDNQVGLQDIAIAQGRGDLVVLIVCTADGAYSRRQEGHA